MKRLLTILLVLSLAVVSAAAQKAGGEKKAKKEKAAAAAKEVRWSGTVVRTNADNKTITVRKDNIERTVVWDTSTKFTKQNKPGDVKDIKDGSRVICLGKYDEKSRLIATRVDLRAPR